MAKRQLRIHDLAEALGDKGVGRVTAVERVSPVVTDNCIHIVFTSFSPPDNGQGGFDDRPFSMRDLPGVGNQWLPESWAKAVSSPRYADLPIWERDLSPVNVSRDLLPPIRSLMSGDAPDKLVRFRLSDQTRGPLRQLFNGKGLSNKKESTRRDVLALALEFTDLARERIGRFANVAEKPLRVSLRDPCLFRFRSGVVLLDFPIELSTWDREPLFLEHMIEAAKVLSQRGALHWLDQRGDRKGDAFSLEALARPLIGGADAGLSFARRQSSCVFVQLEKTATADDLNRASLFLARHLTDDYDVPALEEVDHSRPYAGVQRVVAVEGACIAVALNERSPPFVRDYRQNAFECAYLPLYLLSLHEQTALLRLMESASIWPGFDEDARASLAYLERVRVRASQVRLAFVFPRVSLVASHESWYEALTRQFRLQTLRAGVADDLSSIEVAVRASYDAQLSKEREERRRRLAWAEGVGGGAIATATLFSVLKDVLAPSFSEMVNGNLQPSAIALGGGFDLATAPFIAAIVSLMIGVACGWYLYRREHI